MTMKHEINKSLDILKNGGAIIYPTDTIWGLGCDATDNDAVEKIFTIKNRSESKSLIILVDSWKMLEQYIDHIPHKVSCIIKGSNKPTSVVYNNPKGLAKKVISKDNTVAIRIVQDEFCKKLIQKFQKPIVSTSANFSNKRAPKTFNDIEKQFLDKADYIVNLHRDRQQRVSSQIVKVESDGKIVFIRK